MIKAVFFDLDGTLYDRDALVVALFEQQYNAFAANLADVTRAAFVQHALEMDDHGYGDKEAGYLNLVRKLRLEDALAARLVEHFWENYDRHCRLSDDTKLTLAALRQRGMKLGVVTNGDGVRQSAKLSALGLADKFDAVLISGIEGVRKPDVEIFRRALVRCGVAAPDAMFVGDHPPVDVEGAFAAGLAAVWKHVPYWSPPSADVPVIRSLTELLPLCLSR